MNPQPGTPPLRRRLLDGQTVYGLIVKAPAPALVEMCAAAGFEFAFLDGEHGGADTLELEHHVRAAGSFGIPAVVRVGSHGPREILQVLDTGAEGIVVPHVNTKADVEAIVRAAHYPPVGRRGVATTTRAAVHARGGGANYPPGGGGGVAPPPGAGRHAFVNLKDHLRAAQEHTWIAVQVEDPEAVENVEAIAAVPGVDCVFIGPTDLSVGLGYPGETSHPVVTAAFDRIRRAVASKPKVRLGSFARDGRDARAWVARGASFIALAATTLIAQKFRDTIAEIRADEP